MNPEIKQKWLEALRSGEYKQAQGRLIHFNPEANENSYCCLGVLCDLYAKEKNRRLTASNKEKYNHSMFNEFPSDDVCAWAGFSKNYFSEHYVVDVKSEGFNVDLTELNDSGTSFNEIADLIEESL